MSVADHLREELEEEGEQQQADVHAVHIGIGGDDDAVVAQASMPSSMLRAAWSRANSSFS
jgi:hypothetical protein